MAEVINFKSDCVYFKKMDSSMPSASPVPIPAMRSSPLRLACGVDVGEYVFSSSKVYMNRANTIDEITYSLGDTGTDDDEANKDDDDKLEVLPPSMSKKKNKGRGKSGSLSSSSFMILADSTQKFGELYEKIESSKRQQMAELRMRKEFHRDLEVQKRQILERAQVEIVRFKQEEGEDEEEEEERITREGDDDDNEDDEVDGSVENLSG